MDVFISGLILGSLLTLAVQKIKNRKRRSGVVGQGGGGGGSDFTHNDN